MVGLNEEQGRGLIRLGATRGPNGGRGEGKRRGVPFWDPATVAETQIGAIRSRRIPTGPTAGENCWNWKQALGGGCTTR